jgi:BirA family biotin operon repressor/biotin-[acetyl-CoA-carboxylase] ligase
MKCAHLFLDADELRATTFVRHVEVHQTLHSTNDRAAELARDPTIELPALIAARLQTAGRGRGANKWWSAEGALTFSLLLDSAEIGISVQNWPQLSLATAAAICDAISAEAPRASLSIKSPNDVLIDGRKVCGILVESPSGTAQARNRLIIGVGINVNNSCRAAPLEIRSKATALCHVTGTHQNLQAILVRALQAIEERFRQLAAGEQFDQAGTPTRFN